MYKVNQPILIRFLEVDKASGVNIYIIVKPPSGSEWDPILMQEIDTGLYEASFIPNSEGIWWVRIYCPSKPKNVYAKSYYVGSIDSKILGLETNNNDTFKFLTLKPLFGRNFLHTSTINELLSSCCEEKIFQVSCNVNIPTQNETDLGLLVNPSDSGKIIIIHHILADVLSRNSSCTFNVYINPTVSNYGTPEYIFNRYIKANSKQSNMLAYTFPTITNRGVEGFTFSIGTNTNSLLLDTRGSLIIGVGNTLLLTGIPTANNTQINVLVVWQEESI